MKSPEEPIPGPAATLPPLGESRRHEGLDALRGLLIVTVIIGHFPTSGGRINPFGPVPEWVYFFHIPLFLALSCLFTRPFTTGLMRKRALQLLLPYGIWLVLTRPLPLLAHPKAFLANAAMGNYAHVRSILWFLPALFTTNLLVALGHRAQACPPPARFLARLGLGVLALLAGATWVWAPGIARWHGRVPFGLDVALFLLPFLWVIDQVWQKRRHLANVARARLVPAALLAFALGGSLVRIFERVKTHSAYARRVDFAQFSVPETLPGYLGMTLMGVALLVLACRLPAPRWLAAVGRASMPIYLLHYFLLYALTRLMGLAGENRGWLLLYALVVTALILALAMAITRLLTRLSPRFAWMGLGDGAR